MYSLDLLVTGFPGKSTHHGGLGWSTVSLLRGGGRAVLVDTGGPGCREPLLAALGRRRLDPADVTDVLITHCHWDHLTNYTLFPGARIVVPRPELDWASKQPPGTWHLAELHVARLASGQDDLLLAADGDQVAPGVTALATPGHTPGHFAYRAQVREGEAIFAGDAVKNRVELRTGEADLTLDAGESRRSIGRLRQMLASGAVLVPGHDVRLRLIDGVVYAEGRLQAGVTALLDDTGEPTVFDLTAGGRDR